MRLNWETLSSDTKTYINWARTNIPDREQAPPEAFFPIPASVYARYLRTLIKRAQDGGIKYITVSHLNSSLTYTHRKLNLDWTEVNENPEISALRAVISRRRSGADTISYTPPAVKDPADLQYTFHHDTAEPAAPAAPLTEMQLDKHTALFSEFDTWSKAQTSKFGLESTAQHSAAVRSVLHSRSIVDDQDEMQIDDASAQDANGMEPRNAKGLLKRSADDGDDSFVFLKPASVLKKAEATNDKLYYRPSTRLSLMELDIMETELAYRLDQCKQKNVAQKAEFMQYLLNEFSGDANAVKEIFGTIEKCVAGI
ncbi:MAG: hypothetical protein SGCHY_004476 [Lobulomycetales sp.]